MHNNHVIQVAPSAARTADWTFLGVNSGGKYAHLIIDITAWTAGSLTVTVRGKVPVINKTYTILATAALVAVATTVLKIGPALTAAANAVANDFLPHDFEIFFDHADATSITYSANLQINP
jgi:hypothetical protein